MGSLLLAALGDKDLRTLEGEDGGSNDELPITDKRLSEIVEEVCNPNNLPLDLLEVEDLTILNDDINLSQEKLSGELLITEKRFSEIVKEVCNPNNLPLDLSEVDDLTLLLKEPSHEEIIATVLKNIKEIPVTSAALALREIGKDSAEDRLQELLQILKIVRTAEDSWGKLFSYTQTFGSFPDFDKVFDYFVVTLLPESFLRTLWAEIGFKLRITKSERVRKLLHETVLIKKDKPQSIPNSDNLLEIANSKK